MVSGGECGEWRRVCGEWRRGVVSGGGGVVSGGECGEWRGVW